MLLTRGQQNHVMYMILAGKLGVHLDSETSEAVAYLESGDTVGELSVMDGSPASAFVVAAAPARLLAVDETAFWDLVHESHAFAVNLLRSLVQRLRANNTTVSTNIALQPNDILYVPNPTQKRSFNIMDALNPLFLLNSIGLRLFR